MLAIRLYKGCILNGNYNYVFSNGKRAGMNRTVFEEYLDTLAYIDIAVPFAYYTNSRTLNIEYKHGQYNIYDYNYMRIMEFDEEQENERLRRYCFIDSIEIRNDVCVISYSEDIWHSYINNVLGIKKSFWSNSRVNGKLVSNQWQTLAIKNLPVEYEGYKGLVNDFNSITKNNKFYLLVTIQYYNASSYGTSTKRFYRTFLINKSNVHAIKLGDSLAIASVNSSYYGLSLNEIYSSIIYLTQAQSRQTFKTQSLDNFYMEIDHFTILPYLNDFHINFFGANISKDEETDPFLTVHNNWIFDKEQDEDGNADYDIYVLCVPIFIPEITIGGITTPEDDRRKKMIALLSGTISNPDYKIISLGTLSTQVPIKVNGTDIYYEILVNVSQDNCYVYLNTGGEFTDITKDFTYNPPFNVISGEENALRRMNRHLGIISGILSLGSNLAKGGLSIAGAVGLNNSLEDRMQNLMYTRTGRLTTSRKKLDQIENLRERKSEIPDDLTKSLLNPSESSANSILDIVKLNAPYYSISKGSFISSDAVLNALFGIKIFKINSSNDDYVKKSVKNSGFEIYEIIDDISVLGLNQPEKYHTIGYNYNTIRFSSCDIYGSFPTEIAEQLNDIFLKGFKVWFIPTLQEDANDF